MGNSWSSTTNIYVFLDKGSYKPGDTVTGNVCVATNDKAINLSSLHLKVEGSEATRWRCSNSSCSHTHNGSTSMNDGLEWQTGSRTFLQFEVPLHSYTKEKEGQYQHPFSFVLPNNIPGSFKYEGNDDARAELKYSITACLHSGGGAFSWGGKLQHSADLHVIDPVLTHSHQPMRLERQGRVASCWGCCLPLFPFLSQGSVQLSADVATASAAAGSEIPVAVTVQNLSSANLELRVALRRSLQLRGQNAHGSGRSEKFDADVWTAHQTSSRAYDRATRRTAFSPQLPPTAVRSVATELISCAYELVVEAVPLGGCCGRACVLRFPMHVGDAAGEYLNAEKLPAAPPDWHPHVFPDKRLELPPPPAFQRSDLPSEPGFFSGYDLQWSSQTPGPSMAAMPDHHPLPSAPPADMHVEGIVDSDAEESAAKRPLLGSRDAFDSQAVV